MKNWGTVATRLYVHGVCWLFNTQMAVVHI